MSLQYLFEFKAEDRPIHRQQAEDNPCDDGTTSAGRRGLVDAVGCETDTSRNGNTEGTTGGDGSSGTTTNSGGNTKTDLLESELVSANYSVQSQDMLVAIVLISLAVVLFCALISWRIQYKKRRIRQKKKQMLQDIFNYLEPISHVDDLSIRKSPCGGYHVAYVNDEVFLTSKGANTNQDHSNGSNSTDNSSLSSHGDGNDDVAQETDGLVPKEQVLSATV